MKTILSIQSHVASGYVGNRSAVFTLQRLGCEVSFINTVQFSNHTGYGEWTGDIFSPEHIQKVLDGLWKNKTMDKLDALLSGYQGSPELGEIIVETAKQLKEKRPGFIYCCDPVIGDIERGVYVRPEVADFIKTKAIFSADIITPNHFELGYLTDMTLNSIDDVRRACNILHARGIKIIVVTSLLRKDAPPDTIEMLLSYEGKVWLTSTPHFKFKRDPSGSGDVAAAVFLAQYLKTNDPVLALEFTTSALYGLLKMTFEAKSYELQLIAAQDEIVHPTTHFTAVSL
jgi:pyridoxine kinase